jgi:hypothetical protein
MRAVRNHVCTVTLLCIANLPGCSSPEPATPPAELPANELVLPAITVSNGIGSFADLGTTGHLKTGEASLCRVTLARSDGRSREVSRGPFILEIAEADTPHTVETAVRCSVVRGSIDSDDIVEFMAIVRGIRPAGRHRVRLFSAGRVLGETVVMSVE